jgi:hypothetical protein
MPTLEQGANHTLLEQGAADWKARSGAPTPPTDALEGTRGAWSGNGDGTTVTFNIPHGLKNRAGNGITPSSVVNPAGRNAVSAATHWVSSVTTANIVVTFSVAPAAGTGNISFYWVAYK